MEGFTSTSGPAVERLDGAMVVSDTAAGVTRVSNSASFSPQASDWSEGKLERSAGDGLMDSVKLRVKMEVVVKKSGGSSPSAHPHCFIDT